MAAAGFEWDREKDLENQQKHCFGRVAGDIITVRFTYREGIIRIYGAGYWRKGRRIYEEENQVHG
jgi:hypothetical protein